MSKIEQIIGEIEDYIDSCRFQPLSNTKIVVNKDEINELLDDLRQNVPDEVRKYQRIIANRDAILKDAQDKAEEMLRKANEMTSTLVSEHEIMQQAFREANVVIEDANAQAGLILENATTEANNMKVAAIQYTDDSLANIQNILGTAVDGLSVKFEGILQSLQSSLDIANKDRNSLREFSSRSGSAASGTDNLDHLYAEPAVEEVSMPQENDFVENTFEPGSGDIKETYGDMTLEDALKPGVREDSAGDLPEESDYGSVDEIKDFDLAFDDFE